VAEIIIKDACMCTKPEGATPIPILFWSLYVRQSPVPDETGS
jgi:hypothetical protein